MRRCAVVLVLVAFIFSSGGQWAVLQCVAWANMIREYSQMVPVARAVQMTFSGQYPCAMCKAIADRKKQQDTQFLVLAKHDKPLVAHAFSLRARPALGEPEFYVSPDSFLVSLAEAPPVPPPRLA
jgi:hypothetical protein